MLEFMFRVTGDLNSEKFVQDLSELRAIILEHVVGMDHNDLEIRLFDNSVYRGPGFPRIQYPGITGPRVPYTPTINQPSPTNTVNKNGYIIADQEEANKVVEKMNEIIERYSVVTVNDLKELLGIDSTFEDNKVGWTDMTDVKVRQIREGWLLELPYPEEIPS